MLANSPRVALLLSAVLFSTGGAALKALSLTGWQRASFRSAIAAAFLIAVLPQVRRWPTWPTLGVGALYATTVVSFVLANTYATAATAIFVQASAPLVVLLASPLVLREPVRRRDLGFMVGLAVGVVLLVAAPEDASATAPDPALGLLYACVSCLGWSGVVLGLRALARGQDPANDRSPQALMLGNALAFAGALPLALPVTDVAAADVALLCYLGVFQIGVAYLCLTRGLRAVPAVEASVLLMLEPVLNPIWTWLVHDERPHAWTLVGGAVVLSATLVHAALGRRAASLRVAQGR